MTKENIYIKTLQFGADNFKEGVTYNQVREYLGKDAPPEGSNHELSFLNWFFDNFHQQELLSLERKNASSGKWLAIATLKKYYDKQAHMTGEAHQNLIEYIELQEARNSSKKSMIVAIIAIILTIITISIDIFKPFSNSSTNTQPQNKEQTFNTSTIEVNQSEYFNFIENQLKEIKAKQGINWLYYQPAIVNYSSNSTANPPLPPTLINCKFSDIQFTIQLDSLKIINQPDFFDYTNKPDKDSLFNMYGKGIIFSLPFTTSSSSNNYVDYEIINWQDCGTGNYNRLEYK